MGFSRYLREFTVTVEDEEECDEDHYVGSRMICATGAKKCLGHNAKRTILCSKATLARAAVATRAGR